jgi:hypothetical protein
MLERMYRGRIAFTSLVFPDEVVIDDGIKLHPTPEAAMEEVRSRIANVDWGPALGWVEGVKVKLEPQDALAGSWKQRLGGELSLAAGEGLSREIQL